MGFRSSYERHSVDLNQASPHFPIDFTFRPVVYNLEQDQLFFEYVRDEDIPSVTSSEDGKEEEEMPDEPVANFAAY